MCELEAALEQGVDSLALRLNDVDMMGITRSDIYNAYAYAHNADMTFMKNVDGSMDVLMCFDYTVGYELMRALGAGPAYSYSAPGAPLELEGVDVDELELTGRQRDTLERALEVLDELELDGLDEYQRELAIHDWLVDNVTYDDAADDCHDAYGALLKGEAHCVGYSDAFYLLGTLAGLDVSYVAGAAGGDGHAWNAVRLGDRSYFVDVTWDDYDWGAPTHDYFNIPSDALFCTHSYASRHLPNDIAGKYDDNNYFVRSGLVFDTEAQLYDALRTALAAGEQRVQLASNFWFDLYSPDAELAAELEREYGSADEYECFSTEMGGLIVYEVWFDGYDEFLDEYYGEYYDEYAYEDGAQASGHACGPAVRARPCAGGPVRGSGT